MTPDPAPQARTGRRSRSKPRERAANPQLVCFPPDLRVGGARHASCEPLPPSKPERPHVSRSQRSPSLPPPGAWCRRTARSRPSARPGSCIVPGSENLIQEWRPCRSGTLPSPSCSWRSSGPRPSRKAPASSRQSASPAAWPRARRAVTPRSRCSRACPLPLRPCETCAGARRSRSRRGPASAPPIGSAPTACRRSSRRRSPGPTSSWRTGRSARTACS